MHVFPGDLSKWRSIERTDFANRNTCMFGYFGGEHTNGLRGCRPLSGPKIILVSLGNCETRPGGRTLHFVPWWLSFYFNGPRSVHLVLVGHWPSEEIVVGFMKRVGQRLHCERSLSEAAWATWRGSKVVLSQPEVLSVRPSSVSH